MQRTKDHENVARLQISVNRREQFRDIFGYNDEPSGCTIELAISS